MPLMQIGILLLNWNNQENILPLVARISCWNNPIPIIIVDNASKTDISDLFPYSIPKPTIIKNSKNRGFSGGNNVGFRYCIEKGFEFILLLNHDAQISEEIVQILLETIIADPEVGVIGPCILEGEKKYAGGRNIAHFPVTRIPCNSSGPILQNVEYIPGAACIIRISALKRAGLFDEQFFFSGEMADLCKRIRDCGYSCIVHTAVCICHNIMPDTKMRETIHQYYTVRNRYLFIRKYERGIWMMMWIFFSTNLIIRAIIRKKPHIARAVLLGIIDGVMGRYGDHNEYFIH